MKLDLQKVYDRVNWKFLQAVLLNFGFHEMFVNWVMECVSSVSFSVLINGGKSKPFTLSRGLRQGDPLSPYLFNLCQDVLVRMIDHDHLSGIIKGVSMNVGGPASTNVMFADDIMLFSKACTQDVVALNNFLETYYSWSDQPIN